MLARLGLVALLGLGGTLLACGGDDRTTGDTTTGTTTGAQTTVTPSPEQLDATLLDAIDVGAAWQLGPAISDADTSDATQIPCADTAINPTIADRLTPVTGVQFEPVDRSSKHLIEFAVTGQPGRLDADLQVLFDGMEACAATTPTTTGTGSLTVQPLAIPELGDQRAAFTLIGVESPATTWYVRNGYVRVGAIAVQIGLTEILQTAADDPSISDADFVQLMQTAVAKLTIGTSAGMANPASEYCVAQGGQLDIVDEAGGQVGYCELQDGTRIEEWEYYRSQTVASQP